MKNLNITKKEKKAVIGDECHILFNCRLYEKLRKETLKKN